MGSVLLYLFDSWYRKKLYPLANYFFLTYIKKVCVKLRKKKQTLYESKVKAVKQRRSVCKTDCATFLNVFQKLVEILWASLNGWFINRSAEG